MAGNLREWVLDYHEVYSGSGLVDFAATGDVAARVVRGGDASASALYLRVSYRNSVLATARSATYGFRCARNP